MSWSHRCSMRCSMHLNPCKSLTYSFTRSGRHFESAPSRQAAYCLGFLVMSENRQTLVVDSPNSDFGGKWKVRQKLKHAI